MHWKLKGHHSQRLAPMQLVQLCICVYEGKSEKKRERERDDVNDPVPTQGQMHVTTPYQTKYGKGRLHLFGAVYYYTEK